MTRVARKLAAGRPMLKYWRTAEKMVMVKFGSWAGGGGLRNTVDGLIGTTSHPDMHKFRIIGFLFENKPHWQFAVRLLLFTVCTGV